MKISPSFLLMMMITFGCNNIKKKYPDINEKPEKQESINSNSMVIDSTTNAISDSAPHMK